MAKLDERTFDNGSPGGLNSFVNVKFNKKMKPSGNSTVLAKNLFKEFNIPLDSYSKEQQKKILSGKMPGYEAQHIIPVQMHSHPLIQKIGMDMNSCENGIMLPTPNGHAHALSTHKGFHSVYNKTVKTSLDKIMESSGEDATADELKKKVSDLQTDLRSLLESGMPMYAKKKERKNSALAIEKKGGGATVELWQRSLDNRKQSNMKGYTTMDYEGLLDITDRELEDFYYALDNFEQTIESQCKNVLDGIAYCQDKLRDPQCKKIITESKAVVENVRNCLKRTTPIKIAVKNALDSVKSTSV